MRLLLRAFPADFRRRYGAELLELAESGGRPFRDGLNIVLAGLHARLEDMVAFLRGRAGVGAQVLSLGLIALAAAGGALGGCLVLGSAAAGGSGALVLRRWRHVLVPAR